jgi:hypothetical protein
VLPVPTSQGTLVEQSRAIAEVAAAVQVAQQFPRDVDEARSEMVDLCTRLPIAERAFYDVPNRGTGMSVHIARELARIWGNNDHGVRELRRDDEQGVSEMTVWAWDQQKNKRATRSFIVPHVRMVKGERKVLTDVQDIYLANMNIGARAVREAIFEMLPGWFVKEAEERLQKTLENGGGKPIEERVEDAVAGFARIDVDVKLLEKRVGKPAGKWDGRDLAALARAYTAITVDGIRKSEFFAEEPVKVPVAQPDPEGVEHAAVAQAAAAAEFGLVTPDEEPI